MERLCKNCVFWESPHNGYWNASEMGNCLLMKPDAIRMTKNSGVYGLLEGCVDVFDKRPDFEFVTEKNFGCIHFSKSKVEKDENKL